MKYLRTIFLFFLLSIGHIHAQQSALPATNENKNIYQVSLSKQKINSKGKFNGLVILVEFQDTVFTISNTAKRFREMLNHKGYHYQDAHGSARDYFIANSDSSFFPKFKVIGPIRLSKPMAYYGKNGDNGEEIHAGEMVMEACQLASSKIKFSKYDSNGDGFVDMIYLFFASHCENENSTHKEYIWAHAGNIADSCLVLDGKTIGRYACSSEYIGKINDEKKQIATIGTFCHEFSHILGLPDFYNTTSGSGMTPGSLSLMDRGNYLNSGKCPAGYSAFEKEYVGWLDVPQIEMQDSITSIVLSPVGNYTCNDTLPCAFKVTIPDSEEYFYFENRQNQRWDQYLPGTGLLIYHVDMSDKEAWDKNKVNTDYKHPNYQILRSGGKYETNYQNIPFPGKKQKSTLSPPPIWKGGNAFFELENIREEGNLIKFNLIKK